MCGRVRDELIMPGSRVRVPPLLSIEGSGEEAVAFCANAIILDAVSEPSAGAKVAGAFLGTGSERKGKAITIYVFPADSVRN